MTQTQTQKQSQQVTQIETTTIDNNNLEEIQKIISQKPHEIVPVELQPQEVEEIENTFKDVKDFRQLGEKITAPIDSIIEKTSKIIESDPIMDVSKELEQVNQEVQSVYKEIIDDDGAFTKFLKSLPVVGNLVDKIDNKIDDLKFNMKDIQGKIEEIFSGFDQSYQSLVKSIEMQKEFLN
jgi:DNA repair ATPase RecN